MPGDVKNVINGCVPSIPPRKPNCSVAGS